MRKGRCWNNNELSVNVAFSFFIFFFKLMYFHLKTKEGASKLRGRYLSTHRGISYYFDLSERTTVEAVL